LRALSRRPMVSRAGPGGLELKTLLLRRTI
jgi:hypothetical protein